MAAFLTTLVRLFLPVKSRRMPAFVLAATGKAGLEFRPPSLSRSSRPSWTRRTVCTVARGPDCVNLCTDIRRAGR